MAGMIKKFSGQHAWLSNFHPCLIPCDGLIYPSVEHAFQASKTDCQIAKEAISTCSTPGQAKRMGRTVKLIDRWDDYWRLTVMFHFLLIKFADRDLADRLIATGDDQLIEGNRWGDRFWGTCGGTGSNHLGKQLMLIRQFLTCVKTDIAFGSNSEA